MFIPSSCILGSWDFKENRRISPPRDPSLTGSARRSIREKNQQSKTMDIEWISWILQVRHIRLVRIYRPIPGDTKHRLKENSPVVGVTNWRWPPYREANPESPRVGIWIRSIEQSTHRFYIRAFSSLSQLGILLRDLGLPQLSKRDQGANHPPIASKRQDRRKKVQPQRSRRKKGLAGGLSGVSPHAIPAV